MFVSNRFKPRNKTRFLLCICILLWVGLLRSGTLADKGQNLYKTYQSGIHCLSSESFRFPQNVDELQSIIKEAKEKRLTVKAVGSRHSTTDIICTEGIPVSLRHLNGKEIDLENGTASFGAGCTLKDVLEFLQTHNRTLINVPLYSGITLGGALGTGSHASSLRHVTSISDQVLSLEFIDGSGNLRNTQNPEELALFRVNLGLLGILTRVTLRTVPLFKLRVENRLEDEKLLFSSETVLHLAKGSDHFQMWWFPSHAQVVIASGNHTDVLEEGYAGANYVMDVNEDVAQGTAFIYDFLHKIRSSFGLSFLEKNTMNWLTSAVDGISNVYEEDGQFKNPATGYAWRMLSASCTPGLCWWDNPWATVNGLESSLAFDLSEWEPVLKRIRSILNDYPAYFHNFGIFIRFSKPSSSLLSISHGRRTFTLEWVIPIRKDPYSSTVAGLGTFQALLQELVTNHGGRPHWGKNGLHYFTPAVLSLAWPSSTLAAMRTAMKKYDPDGVFLNKFGARFVGNSEEMDIDFQTTRCALNDYCICRQDEDCGEWQTCSKLNGFNVCLDGFFYFGLIHTAMITLVVGFGTYIVVRCAKRMSRL